MPAHRKVVGADILGAADVIDGIRRPTSNRTREGLAHTHHPRAVKHVELASRSASEGGEIGGLCASGVGSDHGPVRYPTGLVDADVVPDIIPVGRGSARKHNSECGRRPPGRRALHRRRSRLCDEPLLPVHHELEAHVGPGDRRSRNRIQGELGVRSDDVAVQERPGLDQASGAVGRGAQRTAGAPVEVDDRVDSRKGGAVRGFAIRAGRVVRQVLVLKVGAIQAARSEQLARQRRHARRHRGVVELVAAAADVGRGALRHRGRVERAGDRPLDGPPHALHKVHHAHVVEAVAALKRETRHDTRRRQAGPRLKHAHRARARNVGHDR
mmetsp:Transcript_37818/g.100492  ORF Transcript_37818/g.100492 Transcript_37818/m.100492 type:complete len:327 (+) Transcript_37818:8756-9736(+)